MPFPYRKTLPKSKQIKRFTAKQKVDLFNYTRILICGAREWDDYALMLYIFGLFNPDVTIIQGACRGADLMAQQIAIEKEMEYLGFPAKWKQQGKPAGPRRNNRMLKMAKPEAVIAFHNDINNSKGTSNMVSQARRFGIPVYIISK